MIHTVKWESNLPLHGQESVLYTQTTAHDTFLSQHFKPKPTQQNQQFICQTVKVHEESLKTEFTDYFGQVYNPFREPSWFLP